MKEEIKSISKDEMIELGVGQYLFLSDGTKALHLYKEDLKEEFPCVKTWKDLLTYLEPSTMCLYTNGYCQQIIITI